MPLHPNSLFYGDNLEVLRNREDFPPESIDLVYLDPPFNSKRDYNVIYKTPAGHESDSQITAFEDSWHWGEQAEEEYYQLTNQSNTDLSQLIQSLRKFLNATDMMAYLVMMANRLIELHRILKPTGSLYLHCDPTASHYLKILLDSVFRQKTLEMKSYGAIENGQLNNHNSSVITTSFFSIQRVKTTHSMFSGHLSLPGQ